MEALTANTLRTGSTVIAVPPHHTATVARRPLSVGLIAPPWVTVPPGLYGGTEIVVDQLARGLTARGCDVTLFTAGDSTCPVQRRWHYSHALSTIADLDAELAHVRHAYEVMSNVDIVHDHTLLGPIWARAHGHPGPVVTTMHGRFTPDLIEQFRTIDDRVEIVAISESQRRSAVGVRINRVIHHGLDLGAFPFGGGDGGYVLFLGRMSPDKGAHRAIEIARAAGRKILLAAKMWEPCEHRYFAEQVEPLLGDDAIFLGAVGGPDKLDLLGRAAALVNPIRWPEPFGLVMIEALACGTPVLSFPEGAAPEIVDHGRTGFLCHDNSDMTARLTQIDRIDRGACRQSVADRFSTERMVADHLELYASVRAAAAARASRPNVSRR